MGQWMKAMQSMGPAANNNDLTKPGPKSIKQPREGVGIIHDHVPFMSRSSKRFRINSACSLNDLPPMKVSPRMAMPVAALVSALVLAWPAIGLMKFGDGGHLWLAIAPLLLSAGGLSFVAARSIASRRENTIEVSAKSFSVFETLVDRDQVTSIRRHVDLWFKGVQIDLHDGGWIKIPVHLHRPSKVLAVFDKYGYPVTKK
jgi:hypothetical protein